MIWGKASDLSPGGCFVEMPIPLPAETKFEIVMWMGGTKLRLQGQVAGVSPGFGIGVRFLNISPKDADFIKQHMKSPVLSELGSTMPARLMMLSGAASAWISRSSAQLAPPCDAT